MNGLTIYTDGGSRGNPGKSACAYAIYNEEALIAKDSKYLGIATNNHAEYNGVIFALEWLLKNSGKFENVSFYLDSELVVKQLNGLYKIKDENLLNLSQRVKELIHTLNLVIVFKYIPREQNKLADKLVNECLDVQNY